MLKHNHITRDIKKEGECPACDAYHANHKYRHNPNAIYGDKQSEDEVDQLVQLAAAKHGILLMRNNSGALKNENGTPVRFGLHNISPEQNEKFKSSDRIAIMPITITPEMVGKTVGVFVAVEMKKSPWEYTGKDREEGQKNFIDYINARGGVAFFCESVETFNNAIDTFKERMKA